MALSHLLAAEGPDEEHFLGSGATGEIVQQFQGWAIGPVEIIEEDDQRRLSRGMNDELRDGLEEAALLVLRGQRVVRGQIGESFAQFRKQLSHLGQPHPGDLTQMLHIRSRQVASQSLDERLI